MRDPASGGDAFSPVPGVGAVLASAAGPTKPAAIDALAPAAALGPSLPGEAPLRRVAGLALVAVQLLVALFVIYQYQLESRTFFNVMALASAGFVVHALLPLPFRLHFFVAMSIAAILVAMGWRDGLSIVVLGLAMIGICHLPIRIAWRAALLLVVAAAFAVWRLELVPAPWSVAIWPILASMFMFRIALYLHALKHDEKRPTAARTLAYFFMLPNVCFPLFPVVDYATFRRTYFDRDAIAIYHTGMKWIARGLVHLVLYRLVYVHFASDPADLRTLGDLVQFLLATFLLYLRVSGQFHLITGVLHLYGFRLPETHHLYFLASSFTDFWRRINIYWKDFMMKLVYYPSFFQLRRFGGNFALVAATVAVFLATWILHSYQWFWLRGGFPIEPQDGLFWGVLCALVAFGALREMKRPRARKLMPATSGWSLSLALRTVGTFAALCVLWSLWSAESVLGWLLMWGVAGTIGPADAWLLLGLLILGVAVAGKPWSVSDSQNRDGGNRQATVATMTSVTLIVLLLAGLTHLYSNLAPRTAEIVASLQRSTLNARDANLQHKGYYENLDNASRQSAQLWNVRARKPSDWIPLSETPAHRARQDFLGSELVPNSRITFLGQPLTTNQWGMRDRERTRAKPDGVYRIAMLGPSHVMGSGVGDDETIARLLEEKLNASPELRGMRYEVLNFGVAAYALTNQLAMLQDRVLSFAPDAVFVVDSPRLADPVVRHLTGVVARGTEIPFPRLAEAVREVRIGSLAKEGVPVPFDVTRAMLEGIGIGTRMPWREAEQRLRRSESALIESTMSEIAGIARRHNVVAAFVLLDVVREPSMDESHALDHAKRAGMLAVDLSDAWEHRDMSSLRVAEWDNHANGEGNRLLADRFLDVIVRNRGELRLLPEGRK
jgi:hypothetical protein